ncbi:MAG TPA: aldo/keto reductase [Acidimicrobiia bacterium]|nr:aldo/keto reductase [Acidimicrobiia bacterium]
MESVIKRRTLGSRSGLRVSEVGLGLWAAGGDAWGPTEDEASLDAIDAARDAGVNFFDTADVYGAGHSEELLGRAMEGRRSESVVATKIGWIDYDDERDISQYDSVARLVAGVEGSLRRLGTDYVDVIQCHIDYPEPNTPIFIEGFRKLKEDEKVRAWGVSTSDFGHLRTFNAEGDCDVLQTDYSILNRTAEREILPYCRENGIGVIVRGPLAMGLLTGKYSAIDTFPEGDVRRAWVTDPEQNKQFLADLDVVEALRSVMPEGDSLARFAIRFVLDNPTVSTVIPGAKNRRQAEANAAAGLRQPFTDEERQAVNNIVPPEGGRKIWPA